MGRTKYNEHTSALTSTFLSGNRDGFPNISLDLVKHGFLVLFFSTWYMVHVKVKVAPPSCAETQKSVTGFAPLE